MKCPYCGSKDVTPPKVKKWDTPSLAHGLCNTCKKKPRVKISWSSNGNMHVSYSRDGRKSIPEYDRKMYLVARRLSKRDIDKINSGEYILTLDKKYLGVYTVSVTETV